MELLSSHGYYGNCTRYTSIEALDHMGEAIQDNIRKVDVCTRYSAMQYLIILSHPAETQIPNIMSRIFMEYYKLQDSQHFTPSYEYISMKK